MHHLGLMIQPMISQGDGFNLRYKNKRSRCQKGHHFVQQLQLEYVSLFTTHQTKRGALVNLKFENNTKTRLAGVL